MIDLLRVRLEGFNQGRILREMIPDNEIALIAALRKIKEEWRREERPPNTTWLYDQYASLADAGVFLRLDERLKNRIRQDTIA